MSWHTAHRLLAVLALSVPAVSYAFVPSGFRVRLPVPYEVNTASSQELGRATTLQVISDSYANWAAPQCSGYTSELRGETNAAWNAGDGVNTLIWIYNANQRPRELGNRSTIGVTLSIIQGNRGVDGDILFNGIDHTWTTNAVRDGQVDAVSIITHETGHQLGLNHSPQQAATMFAAYIGGNAAASLAADDIEGVCTLYPSGAAPQCQNDGECGDGQSCVGGECIDAPAAGAGLGDPCEPAGCGQGFFCARQQDGTEFCTRDCGAGCPGGWACERIRFGNQGNQVRDVCWPDAEGGGGAAPFGSPCESAQDCASGFCVSNGQEAFCTQACSDDADCPQDAECVRTQGGGGACLPGAPGGPGGDGRGFGEACEDHGECASMICVGNRQGGGFCSALCDRSSDCPDGAACQEATNGQGVCVPNEGGGGAYGDPCEGGQDCDSEICLDDGNRSFCSARCTDLDDCPPGSDECVQTNQGGACVPGDDPPPPPPEDDAAAPPGNLPPLDAGPGVGQDAGPGRGPADAAVGQRFPQPEAGPTLVAVGTPQGGGCHCSTTPTGPAPLPLLLGGLLLAWRARTRLRT